MSALFSHGTSLPIRPARIGHCGIKPCRKIGPKLISLSHIEL